MFDVEFRLLDGVEADDQFLKPRGPGDHDYFILGESFHTTPQEL
jgi:hypothetical protein